MVNKGNKLQSLSKGFVLLSIMTLKTNAIETGKEMEAQLLDVFRRHFSHLLPLR